MSALERKALMYLLIAIAAVLWWGNYQSLRKKAAVGDMRGEKIERTVEQLSQNEAAHSEGQAVESRVQLAREDYNRKVEHEPSLAEHRNRPVPERMRSLARERRLARERAGGVAPGREGTAQAEDASQR